LLNLRVMKTGKYLFVSNGLDFDVMCLFTSGGHPPHRA